MDARIEAEHATSVASAVAILGSERLLSQAELVRLKIINDSTHGGDETDRLTGEDDAIFFALTTEDAQRSDDDYFGNVVLKFKKDTLLEEGYFTPYAFGKGTPPGEGPSDPASEGMRLYRSFVFSGREGFKRFLTVSVAQTLWEEAKLPFGTRADALGTLAKMKERALACDRLDPRSDPKFSCSANDPRIPGWTRAYNECVSQKSPRTLLAPLYSMLDQVYPDKAPAELDHFQVQGVYRYFSKDISVSKEKAERVFSAFRAMPFRLGGRSFFDREGYNWWELKVSKKVSLAALSRVEVSDAKPENVARIRAAVKAFARKHGTRVSEQVMPGDESGMSRQVFSFVSLRAKSIRAKE